MSDETLPALVARVRGEGEKAAKAQSEATDGPWHVGPSEPGKMLPVLTDADLDLIGYVGAKGQPIHANAALWVLARNSALPADALVLCEATSQLAAACREVAEWFGEITRDGQSECVEARLYRRLRAALAGVGPAETPAEAADFDAACDFPPPDPEAVDRAIREHRERHPYRGAGGAAEGDAGGGGS